MMILVAIEREAMFDIVCPKEKSLSKSYMTTLAAVPQDAMKKMESGRLVRSGEEVKPQIQVLVVI